MAEVGEKVKGNVPPHGGSWSYDAEKDELTLIETPTPEAEAPPAEKEKDNA